MGRAEALARAHQLAAAGNLILTRTVQGDVEGLEYDIDDVVECIQSCCLEDIEKDMPDQYRPGALVLVFDPMPYGEDDLYVKFSVPSKAGETLNVLSFKLTGSPR